MGTQRFSPKVSEQLDFAKGTRAKHGMVERSDTLDGDLGPGGLMNC
mgnify:CR=1 FL=1